MSGWHAGASIDLGLLGVSLVFLLVFLLLVFLLLIGILYTRRQLDNISCRVAQKYPVVHAVTKLLRSKSGKLHVMMLAVLASLREMRLGVFRR